MASIRKRGNSYLIVVSRGYDYQKKRIKPAQKTVHPPADFTKKQVEKWLNEQAVLFEMKVKNQTGQLDRNMTLHRYIEHWQQDIAPVKLAETTFEREKQDIKRILPEIGHYKLTEINQQVLREFYEVVRQQNNKKTGKPLSESTVEGVHACLCGILTDAVEEGCLTHNPAWRAYRRKEKRKEIFAADEKLLQKVIEAVEQESLKYEVYFKLIIATGMRRGECCALRWSDINYSKKSIKIERGAVSVSKKPVQVRKTKTYSGTRTVYISREMVNLLKDYHEECEWFYQQSNDGEFSEDEYLFRQPNSRPMVPGSFTYRFNIILKKNQLPKELTVHSLRHTHASLLISQNVDVRTVAGLLGHAQPSTTLDIYSHTFDKSKREAQKKLENVIEI